MKLSPRLQRRSFSGLLTANTSAHLRVRWLVIFCCLLLSPLLTAPVPLAAQETEEQTCIAVPETLEERYACLTPAERIGQLFLITFEGDAIATDTQLSELILDYHVGGVILHSDNNNISNMGGDTRKQIEMLTAQLQALAVSPTHQVATDPGSIAEVVLGELPSRTPIPMLIGIAQEGHTIPHATIDEPALHIPSALALGATWDINHAHAAGAQIGSQLAALGINLLIGPTLNVSNSGQGDPLHALNTRSFGSSPEWVGRFGRAYIDGVKAGSQHNLLVVAGQFPANGNGQEIATVRRSIDELRATDLQPFLHVAASIQAEGTLTETHVSPLDGLMASHIRYQGFDGTLRDTTLPVSLSPSAQAELLAFEPLQSWHASGGLIVSDNLGVQAIRDFYGNTDGFPNRQIAKDAFAAGNDLLYLGNFGNIVDDSDESHYENIVDTITWFQERYELEPNFQQQVDRSVLRILRHKEALYGVPFNAAKPAALSAEFSTSSLAVSLPSEAITLISPSSNELQIRLPAPPAAEDRIVIFTDIRSAKQCDTCSPRATLGLTALADRIIARYGPEATNQINPGQIQNFSFDELDAYLSAKGVPILLPTPTATATAAPQTETEVTPTPEGAIPTIEPTPFPPPPGYLVQEALRDVDWVIFAMQDISAEIPSSDAVVRYLDQLTISDTSHVIAFAFDAPWFLDASEIVELSAYYGVYSQTEAFIDAAVQALFQDLAPTGKASVDIEGVGYSLANILQPDPAQKIELKVLQDSVLSSPSSEEPIRLEGGEGLQIQTGVILDHNGNPVPDGTLVRFIDEDFTESRLNVLQEVATQNGIAMYQFSLPDAFSGRIRIRATAGDATTSDEVNISGDALSVATPTLVPTEIPTPIPTATSTEAPAATPTPPPTATLIPSPTPTPVLEPGVTISLSEGQTLLSLIVGLFAVGFVTLVLGRKLPLPVDDQVRLILWSCTTALIVYIYFALGLPGNSYLSDFTEPPRAIMTSVGGGVLGILTYYLFNDRN